MRLNYAIIFVADMQRSIGFYRDILGLPLKFESPEWTEFLSGGATLALHQEEAAIEGGDDRGDTAAGQCRPGFSVDDLAAFHARMGEHGVEVVKEPREVFGVRIGQYRDPDGVIISVSEDQPND